MNKQEFINILNQYQKQSKEHGADTEFNKGYDVILNAITELAEQLDEPSREECEIEQVSKNESECSNCSHTINHYTFTFDEEYEIPADGYEFYQVNYCPNCGAKIKREKSDE